MHIVVIVHHTLSPVLFPAVSSNKVPGCCPSEEGLTPLALHPPPQPHAPSSTSQMPKLTPFLEPLNSAQKLSTTKHKPLTPPPLDKTYPWLSSPSGATWKEPSIISD